MTELTFKGFLIGVVIALAHTDAHNIPGRSVGYAHPELRRRGAEGRSTATTLRFVSNAHFRVVYPQSLDTEQAERILNILESGRTELLRRVSVAGLRTRFPNLESADEMRAAYGAAYNLKQLIRVEGENKVWKRFADQSYSVNATATTALTT